LPSLVTMRTVRPLNQLDAQIRLPGSKSYTQRALIMAALAAGSSLLQGPLLSEDTACLTRALQALGADLTAQPEAVVVRGTGGRIQNPQQPLYLENNGTALRLLTTVVCLGEGPFVLTGAPRLLERPVQPLLVALTGLGVQARGGDREGFPPVFIEAHGLEGGRVRLGQIESSQYVSSLLISAPYGRNDLMLELKGPVPSRPYIEMTVEVMEQFGGQVQRDGLDHFRVSNRHPYQGRPFLIEGDVSSASYFFLAAALCRGRVRVGPIFSKTRQGDIGFLKILEQLGHEVRREESSVEVIGGNSVAGDREFDLGDMPDMVPTLAVLAACRPGRTAIRQVAHLRIKESNRLAALITELGKAGIEARELEDGLVIKGGHPHGAEIETYNDHRIAMSFAVLGLVTPGMTIQDPDCVQKSFPGFWQVLEALYG
jgi:3-phosphoshikimate 1-carboxyvinyltransferase